MNKVLLCLLLVVLGGVFCDSTYSIDSLARLPNQAAKKLSTELLPLNQISYPFTAIVEFQADIPRNKISKINRASKTYKEEQQRYLKSRAESIRNSKKNFIEEFKRDRKLKRDYEQIAMSSITITSFKELKKILSNNLVKMIYPEITLTKSLIESRPLIKADTVVNSLAVSGAGTSIVVLDTGVDYTLSEFGSCLAPASSSDCRVVEAFDIAIEDNQLDDDGHGTNVAAVVAGVTSETNLIVLDVFNGETATSTDVIAGIDWAIANQVSHNIVGINLSLGGSLKFSIPCISGFGSPITIAKNNGIATVTSSGNDGYVDGFPSPACVPEAISVGAVYDANVGSLTYSNCSDLSTMVDQITCFSNSASFLDLLAPGALINAGGLNLAGTSQAAPHVSAAMALLSSAYPGESVDTKLARLKNNGTLITDARNGLSFPRIDLLSAIGAINDNFDDAITLQGISGSLDIVTTNATQETNEPLHAGISNNNSVWFEYIADETGVVTIDTNGSGYNTVIAVYIGNELNNLLEITSDTNQSSFQVQQNIRYKIVVVDVEGVGGDLVLNFDFSESEDIPIPSMSLSAMMLQFICLLIIFYRFAHKIKVK